MQKLLDKQYVGTKLEEFWTRHGFKTTLELQAKTGITNLNAYPKGKAFPRWEGLVQIADACQSDVASLVKVIDPTSDGNDNTKIPVEHRKTIKLLLELLTEAPEEARRWLIGNIETFHKAYLGRGRR